ncbi:MAG: AAA family ATPase, partial [Deltaproteobacteria bacterium]|nr:AAA family ATPase [Deltaproteobacteria bacterium]
MIFFLKKCRNIHYKENLHHFRPDFKSSNFRKTKRLKGGKSVKIAISGKGGVGKTTFASFLIKSLADQGKKVLAIDADPDANLAQALGARDTEHIVPIAEMKVLIEER